MQNISDLARKWLKQAENVVKPLDPLSGTQAEIKSVSVDSGQTQAPISRRRSPMVNMAHVEALFIAFELEWGRKFTKAIEESGFSRERFMQHWLKRMKEANLDEQAINWTMGQISGTWPPSVGDFIDMCRAHTWEARVGHIDKYRGDRPEPGEGYEQFRAYKERHTRKP